MRAELTAIWVVLKESDKSQEVTIPTDSLCSLQLISKSILRPHLTQNHRHAALLRAIVKRLEERNEMGSETHLVKVRSHTDIDGNEQADEAADIAALAKKNKIEVVATPTEHKHLFEFISTTNGLLGNNNEEPILTDGKSFLKASHDSRVNAHCRTDPKSTASKWAAGSVRSSLIPSLSNHFRTLKAHLKVKRTMWLIRSNTWVGNAKLKQWGKSNTSACPHCTPRPGQTTYDDATHVAGACSHPYVHNLMTCRHDRGTHLMYDAITKAHHECDTWQVNVHAGRRYQESDETLKPTIPDWAIPNYRGCAAQTLSSSKTGERANHHPRPKSKRPTSPSSSRTHAMAAATHTVNESSASRTTSQTQRPDRTQTSSEIFGTTDSA